MKKEEKTEIARTRLSQKNITFKYCITMGGTISSCRETWTQHFLREYQHWYTGENRFPQISDATKQWEKGRAEYDLPKQGIKCEMKQKSGKSSCCSKRCRKTILRWYYHGKNSGKLIGSAGKRKNTRNNKGRKYTQHSNSLAIISNLYIHSFPMARQSFSTWTFQLPAHCWNKLNVAQILHLSTSN